MIYQRRSWTFDCGSRHRVALRGRAVCVDVRVVALHCTYHLAVDGVDRWPDDRRRLGCAR